MTTPKTFSASTTETREAPTESFTLEGVYAQGRSGPKGETTWAENFTVSSAMDARAAGWYANAFTILEGKQAINPPAIIEFLAIMCLPEAALRFRALIDDPDRLVEVKVLGEVFLWLTEEVIARPTAPPSA